MFRSHSLPMEIGTHSVFALGIEPLFELFLLCWFYVGKKASGESPFHFLFLIDDNFVNGA